MQYLAQTNFEIELDILYLVKQYYYHQLLFCPSLHEKVLDMYFYCIQES